MYLYPPLPPSQIHLFPLSSWSPFSSPQVMHVRGHFVNPMVGDHLGNQPVFMAQCSPLVTPDVKESVTESNTMIFRSVHGLDMKYIEIASK